MYKEVTDDNDVEAQRELCSKDLFYLLTVGCNRRDIDDDWLYARCREVEADPNGFLDLWAREHYKSTIITFGKTIQGILNNPDITVGIFSHTRPIAKAFLKQIQREFEENEYLQDLFPEVLYKKPKSESPSWSADNGITVRRKTNPKEATIEAWGLVDGQPTSKHFSLLIYDDVVTKESVTNEEQIRKTTEAWELSLNLGAHGGVIRYIGTRYHFKDTWKTILDRGSATPRIHAATKEGTHPGTAVFLDQKTLDKKRRDQGPYTFSCQQLLNPVADKNQGFLKEWLRFITQVRPEQSWNRYLICDPAGEKKKKQNHDPDYTVMGVIGLAPDNNYYLIDAIRDRMNLTERTEKMFEMYQRWLPTAVGYEKYGKDSDIEHIQYVQRQRNFRFEITPLGGAMSKNDRIKRLVPKFEQHRFYMPNRLLFLDQEGNMRDFVREFIDDEYLAFPVAVHDDMLDMMSRIDDIGAVFPKTKDPIGIPGLKKPRAVANNSYNVLG